MNYLQLTLWWAAFSPVADSLRAGGGGTHSGRSWLGRAFQPEELEVLAFEASESGDDDLQLFRSDAPPPQGSARPEDVDAWLHQSHKGQSLERSMYLPALYSLQKGLEARRATTRIVDRHNNGEMVDGVREAVAQGRRPLVVTVGIFWANEEILQAIRACKEAGALLVLYSTEPAASHKVTEMAKKLGVHEVWEYAWSNIARYSSSFKSQVPVRYIPPGFVKQLEVGVDLYSRDRQEKQVAFMGRMGLRPPKIREMYASVLGGQLNETYQVWSKESLRNYLNKYPLQVNLHKRDTCCPHDPSEPVAMEAFRMASLLTNKACVVSTPIPESDRRLWEGIVNFAEANETLVTLKELRKDVRGCQVQSALLYRKRFDPKRLLRRSGFLDVWQPANVTQQGQAHS